MDVVATATLACKAFLLFAIGLIKFGGGSNGARNNGAATGTDEAPVVTIVVGEVGTELPYITHDPSPLSMSRVASVGIGIVDNMSDTPGVGCCSCSCCGCCGCCCRCCELSRGSCVVVDPPHVV